MHEYVPACADGHIGPLERVELTAENAYSVREVYCVMARCQACGWGMHVSAMETAPALTTP